MYVAVCLYHEREKRVDFLLRVHAVQAFRRFALFFSWATNRPPSMMMSTYTNMLFTLLLEACRYNTTHKKRGSKKRLEWGQPPALFAIV